MSVLDEIADMVDDLEPGKRITEYVALAEKVKSLPTGEKYAILENSKNDLFAVLTFHEYIKCQTTTGHK